MGFTKSDDAAARQCHKRLWLHEHDRSLAAPPSVSAQFRMRQGSQLGELAHDLFPGGVTAPYRGLDNEKAAEATITHLLSPVPAVFEATVGGDGIWARVDVLERLPGGWRLYEVKSATKPKEEHSQELAFEVACAQRAGLAILEVGLLTVDTGYVYDGVSLRAEGLLARHDVTDEVMGIVPQVGERVTDALAVLAGPMPDIAMGRQCGTPYQCPFFDHCDQFRPADDVSRLYKLKTRDIQALRAQGVHTIGDIPDDAALTAIQRRIVDAVRYDQPYVSHQLASELERVRFPACFVDFEASGTAIPRLPGGRPYQSFPFQWSSHRVESAGAPPVHAEHLHTEATDPRPAFVRTLLDHLDGSQTFVHYSPYEVRNVEALAKEGIEGADRLLDRIRAHRVDLLDLVQEYTYLAKFDSSFSIKSVLPAVAPDLSYDGMEIGDGETAAVEWLRMLNPLTPANEQAAIAASLREYCALDTLAMVRVWEWLREVSRSPSARA